MDLIGPSDCQSAMSECDCVRIVRSDRLISCHWKQTQFLDDTTHWIDLKCSHSYIDMHAHTKSKRTLFTSFHFIDDKLLFFSFFFKKKDFLFEFIYIRLNCRSIGVHALNTQWLWRGGLDNIIRFVVDSLFSFFSIHWKLIQSFGSLYYRFVLLFRSHLKFE